MWRLTRLSTPCGSRSTARASTIYIDRSLVEGFFNSYKSISIRAYVEDPASLAISLFAKGDVVIESLYVAAMGSIFE